MSGAAGPGPRLDPGGSAGIVGGGPAWLFCPADRPDRWDKALARADVVILDLEDAVAPQRRQFARDEIRRAGRPMERTILRINAAGTPDHERDLALLRQVPYRTVMLAKAEDPAAVLGLPDHLVIPLIETPLGVERLGELLSPPNAVGAMWGADDLVVAMGGYSSRRPDGTLRSFAREVRHRTLLAAKARGHIAVDGVHMDIADVAGLRAECEDAAAIGFDATVAIHPSQLPTIRNAYRPSPEQVEWARALVSSVQNDAGVGIFDGRMVDAPVYLAARRILRRSADTGGPARSSP